jgi:hypothetical protein
MARRWRLVHGNTHSRAACEAETRGEMSLTRAVEDVYVKLDCKRRKISRRLLADFLEEHCSRGWHHVAGPNGVREVFYYATVWTDELMQKFELYVAARKQKKVNALGGG